MNKLVGPTAEQNEAARKLRQQDDGRITELAEYGQHIALTCVNHPDLRWSTKNIAPIGCRAIFFNLHGVRDMLIECNCPLGDLRVAHSSEHGT